MLRLGLAVLALAFTLAADDAFARKREESRMYNPSDNAIGAPTPDQFNHEEWARRRSFGLCATLFECASGGPGGYTHLPYVNGDPAYRRPHLYRHPHHRTKRPWRY